jgi:hypothetical protein
MTSMEDNKTIARRWIELVNEHKIEEVCQMTAPTWTMHGGPPGGLPRGSEGVRELFRQIGAIEQEFTIEDLITEGDKVVVRATTGAYKRASLGYLVTVARRCSVRCSFIESGMDKFLKRGETPMI